jgi:hypothetical protein
MFGRSLFRKEALDRLASPEELDGLFTVVRLRRCVLLTGAGLFGLVALMWGAYCQVPETVVETGRPRSAVRTCVSVTARGPLAHLLSLLRPDQR